MPKSFPAPRRFVSWAGSEAYNSLPAAIASLYRERWRLAYTADSGKGSAVIFLTVHIRR